MNISFRNTVDPILGLRYFAALSVMLLHFSGYWFDIHGRVTDIAPVLYLIRNVTLMFPGVVIFFSLSGFFVTGSLDRLMEQSVSYRRAFTAFMKKRVLRIYPALWLNTLFNLLILIFAGNFRIGSRDVAVWFFVQLLGISSTPNSLKSFATGSVNGALWTVFVQMQFYLLLACIYPAVKKKSKPLLACLLAASLLVNIILGNIAGNGSVGAAGKLIERSFLPYAVWFLAGAACRLIRDELFERYSAQRLLTVFVIVYCFIGTGIRMAGIPIPGYYADAVTGTSVSLMTGLFCICFSGNHGSRKNSVPDISYELFLYHWIVLNILVTAETMSGAWIPALALFLALSFALSTAAYFILGQLWLFLRSIRSR